MREKDYNTGLRGVLFEAQHYARMGAAIWLYGWLVLRQTHQTGTTGWVLGGAPISYREIEDETGFNRRTLERWMSMLRRHGYIATESAPGGVVVRILKAKKHLRAASSLPTARNNAEGVRSDAGRSPQNCVATESKVLSREQLAHGISSSSGVRIKERIDQHEIHTAVENSASLAHRGANLSNTSQDAATQEISHCERTAFHQQFQKLVRNSCMKTPCISQLPNPTQNQNPPRPVSHTQSQPQIQRPSENSSARPTTQKSFPWELRARMRLLRAERDEELRRELAVGTGPEVQRP
ncbi:MAG: hypothetical protein WA211_11335 [Candidatus Acidiferrales bacterium]